MTYQKYDLHCHSTCSDGTFSPSEVVQKAQQASIDVLALTDHDTTNGLAEARQMAESLDIRFINGIELSCEHSLTGGYGKNKSVTKIIHVLGLDFADLDTMNERLQQVQASRANRGRAMVSKLAEILTHDPKVNHKLSKCSLSKKTLNEEVLNENALSEDSLWQSVLAKAGGNPESVGRPHIAKTLCELGVVHSMSQAFDKYLGDNKPAYVKIDTLSMAEGIKLIQDCGGQAVLAHPTGYNLSATRVRKLINEFAELGGNGSELPANREPLSKRRMVDKVIADNQLVVSVGSDFHGANMPWRKLGDVPKLTSEQIGVWHKFKVS